MIYHLSKSTSTNYSLHELPIFAIRFQFLCFLSSCAYWRGFQTCMVTISLRHLARSDKSIAYWTSRFVIPCKQTCMVTFLIGSFSYRLKSSSYYGSCTSRLTNSVNCLGSQTCMVTIRLGSIDERLEDLGDHYAGSQQVGLENMEVKPMQIALGRGKFENEIQ